MYIFPQFAYTVINKKKEAVFMAATVRKILFQLLWKDKKKTLPKRKDFLKKSIFDCQQALNDAYLGLQNTNDPDLIDRYIYEWNAAHMRYRVLLREMRELSVSSRISSTNRETETSLLNRSFR
jgi:hypothetical protein